MADHAHEDKTEKASAQKLRKSREQGQVARSKDWSTAIGILVCIKLVTLLVPAYLEDFRSLFSLGFAYLAGDGTPENLWSNLFSTSMLLFIKMLLPLFVIPAATIAGSLFPGGWVFSGAPMMPKFERLNPLSYPGRLLKPKHVSGLLISLAKAVMLGIVLWHLSRSQLGHFLRLQALPLDEAILQGTGLMLDGLLSLCAVFVLFALIDLPVQYFIFMREQRMSKREVKEEYKTAEGRPEVRQRIRQIQNQIARRGLRKAVPGADVVIVNPEHYAVALKYDEKRAQAPFVVAKGVDEMALFIREIAQQHQIELVPIPPLARAIYHTSQVNQQIPAQLYKAVAQVLGYVLQLQAFRSGRRSAAPNLPDSLGIPPQFLTPDPEQASAQS